MCTIGNGLRPLVRMIRLLSFGKRFLVSVGFKNDRDDFHIFHIVNVLLDSIDVGGLIVIYSSDSYLFTLFI